VGYQTARNVVFDTLHVTSGLCPMLIEVASINLLFDYNRNTIEEGRE
jgi:hypothetical protein